MATQAIGTRLTYEDYAKTPDDARFELIDGELIPMAPAPTEPHQRTIIRIGVALFRFVNDNELGEVYMSPFDVVFTETDTVQPDALYVSRERSHIITAANIQGAPDLVVEVLSPSTSERDRNYKRELYERCGVGEYWMADPFARRITVLILRNGKYVSHGVFCEGDTLTSPTLAGFSLAVSEAF